MIKNTVGLVVTPQEGLDPLPQFRIGRTLPIQDRSTGHAVAAFDGREEHSLNTLRVERHRMVLDSRSRFRAP